MFYGPRRGKYNAQRTVIDGISYHSKKEAEYGKLLSYRKTAGDIKDFRHQVRIPLSMNGKLICHYVVDFEIEHLDDTCEFVEVKGMWTDVAKLKWKMFLAQYGDTPKTKFTVE